MCAFWRCLIIVITSGMPMETTRHQHNSQQTAGSADTAQALETEMRSSYHSARTKGSFKLKIIAAPQLEA
jgi:hypothetical protein